MILLPVYDVNLPLFMRMRMEGRIGVFLIADIISEKRFTNLSGHGIITINERRNVLEFVFFCMKCTDSFALC